MSTLPASSPAHPIVRVLIVDDAPKVLRDLRQLLELAGDLDVIGEASNGQEAVCLAASLAPDVVVMDLEMPILNGYEATRQMKSRPGAPRIVILSVHSEPEEMERALAAGADGLVVKGSDYEILVSAIRGNNNLSRLFDTKKGT